jgi:NAD(P)H dehydrogenase (quinone)
MIIVTGAHGRLGGLVLSNLEFHLKKKEYVATSSSKKGVSTLKQDGHQARLANFNLIDTLDNAFENGKKLFLISTHEPNNFEQYKKVINIGIKKGIKHIIYSSMAINDPHKSGIGSMAISHLNTENYIKSCGIDYTIVRNSMYAETLALLAGNDLPKNGIRLPYILGSVPYV